MRALNMSNGIQLVLIISVLVLMCTRGHGRLLDGHQIAVLLTASVEDMGYDNRIVNGVMDMESTLNISGTLILNDIISEAQAVLTMKDLVRKGYQLIISTSPMHGNASMAMAAAYPRIDFGASPASVGATTLPNLYQLTWSLSDMFYIVGVVTATMNGGNSVGLVHPKSPIGPVNSINSFYMGAKSVNPNISVCVVFTTTFVDADVELGAAGVLFDNLGVRSIASYQYDNTIPHEMIKRGLLGIGTSGYPLNGIYGPDVGISIILNWTNHFVTLVTAINKGDDSHMVITGTLADNNILLSTPSFKLTDQQLTTISVNIQPLYDGGAPYYCGSFVEEFGGLDKGTGCLYPNSTYKFDQAILSGVKIWGTYIVPILTNTSYVWNSRLVIIVFIAIGLIGSTISAISCFVYRQYSSIRKASYRLLFVIAIGTIFLFVGAITWVIDANDHVCRARIWLPSMGLTMALGGMIIKNSRVGYGFTGSRIMRMNREKISAFKDENLLLFTAALLVFNMLLLALYSGYGTETGTYVQGQQGLAKYERMAVCYRDTTSWYFLGVIVIYHLLSLLLGCIVSLWVRGALLPDMKESVIMANTILVVAVFAVMVGIYISLTHSTYVQTVVIIGLGITGGTYSILLIMFLPKFIDAYKLGPGGADTATFDAGIKMGGATTSTRTGGGGGGGSGNKNSDDDGTSKNTNSSLNSNKTGPGLSSSSSSGLPSYVVAALARRCEPDYESGASSSDK